MAEKNVGGRPLKGRYARDGRASFRAPARLLNRYRRVCAKRGLTIADGIVEHMELAVGALPPDARSKAAHGS